MITLHHLGHPPRPFHLNRDLILSVEANPDTVISLTTGDKLLVVEDPETVAARMTKSRVDVAAQALERRAGEPVAPVRADAQHHPEPTLTVVSPVRRPDAPASA